MWPSRSPRWWPVKSPRPLFAVSAGSLRPGRRRWRCQQSLSPPRELLLKSARDRMDIISACREAGTYRGAAAISGTTPKTVRRVIARHQAGGGAPARAPRERNYDQVTAPPWCQLTRPGSCGERLGACSSVDWAWEGRGDAVDAMAGGGDR